MGNPLDVKGLTTSKTMSQLTVNNKFKFRAFLDIHLKRLGCVLYALFLLIDKCKKSNRLEKKQKNKAKTKTIDASRSILSGQCF